jgi:HEAT repeat protein
MSANSISSLQAILSVLAMGAALTASGRAEEPADPTPEGIVEFLRTDDEQNQHRFRHSLVANAARVEQFRPALQKALTDADRKVRKRAAVALVESGVIDPAAIEVLRQGLNEPWKVAYYYYPFAESPYAMQAALVKAGEPAVPALLQFLDDRKHPSRWLAIGALGEIGPPAKAALPALAKALQDEKQVRYRVALLESKYQIDRDAASAINGLVPLLDTEEGRHCGGANRVLGRMGADAKAALPALIAAMNKYKEREIVSDLEALFPHFPDEVTQALRDAQKDPELKRSATSALQDLGIIPREPAAP